MKKTPFLNKMVSTRSCKSWPIKNLLRTSGITSCRKYRFGSVTTEGQPWAPWSLERTPCFIAIGGKGANDRQVHDSSAICKWTIYHFQKSVEPHLNYICREDPTLPRKGVWIVLKTIKVSELCLTIAHVELWLWVRLLQDVWRFCIEHFVHCYSIDVIQQIVPRNESVNNTHVSDLKCISHGQFYSRQF